MKKLYIDFDGVIYNSIEVSYDMALKQGFKKNEEEFFLFYKNLNWCDVLKKSSQINDSFNCIKKIIDSGKYDVAILTHIVTLEEALEKIKLIRKNIDDISILEKYDTEVKAFSEVEATVASLYKEKVVVVTKKPVTTGKVNTSMNISYQKVPLSLKLIRPISGIITSRFGVRSSVRSGDHTGLDIGAPTGTPIKAAASGTVTFSGVKKSYGYMVVISHGDGIETYYGHCSKLYVTAGEKVSQGEVIAAVGSTGNSTGPHLHLEVRVNGVAYNPQNYVY